MYFSETLHEARGLRIGYPGSYRGGEQTGELYVDRHGRSVVAVTSIDGPAMNTRWTTDQTFQRIVKIAYRATRAIKPPIELMVDVDEAVISFSVRKRDRSDVIEALIAVVDSHEDVTG